MAVRSSTGCGRSSRGNITLAFRLRGPFRIARKHFERRRPHLRSVVIGVAGDANDAVCRNRRKIICSRVITDLRLDGSFAADRHYK